MAKTTMLGLVSILSTLTLAVKQYLISGQLADFPALVSSLAAGWGLIHAADEKEAQ